MVQFLTTLFFVLLTLKLTNAAILSWYLVCAPLMIISAFFMFWCSLTLMISIAKRLKSKNNGTK